MPRIPDDMSASAKKRRAENSAAERAANRTKVAEPVKAPKPRIAKKR